VKEVGADLVSTQCPPPIGDVTLAEARRVAGSDMCLAGGVDTVNTVWREAIVATQTSAGGYIVGTSDSIVEQTPPENFRAFFEAAKKYGSLPRG
jgi:uroporphyrinogen-III decarboxylase